MTPRCSRPRLRRAVEGSDAFVFVISPDSVRSPFCGQEVDHAVELNKRVVPLALREVADGEIPEEIRFRNWIPVGTTEFAEGVDRLVAAIDTDLEWERQHTRLTVKALEWDAAGARSQFLGARLGAGGGGAVAGGRSRQRPGPDRARAGVSARGPRRGLAQAAVAGGHQCRGRGGVGRPARVRVDLPKRGDQRRRRGEGARTRSREPKRSWRSIPSDRSCSHEPPSSHRRHRTRCSRCARRSTHHRFATACPTPGFKTAGKGWSPRHRVSRSAPSGTRWPRACATGRSCSPTRAREK